MLQVPLHSLYHRGQVNARLPLFGGYGFLNTHLLLCGAHDVLLRVVWFSLCNLGVLCHSVACRGHAI